MGPLSDARPYSERAGAGRPAPPDPTGGTTAAVHARGLTLRYRTERRADRRARRPRRPTGPPRPPEEGAPPPRRAEPPGIHAVDLDCAPGTILGVLGPNGAGKSTLLRLLATALRPDAGELRLLGRPAAPPAAALRRRIGWAADAPALFEPLDGLDNVRFYARAAGMGRADAERAAAALLERLGLGADLRRPARAYSHGMRRKLLLAQALVHSPALAVLDEPTIGLDPPSVDALRELLRERAAAGAAVVLSTHDVHEAERLCDRILFLHRGRGVLEGPTAALVAQAPAAARIDVRIAAPRPPELRLEDAEVFHATADRLLLHAAAGGRALPALCAALVEQGAEIRSIRVREPDLGDVFRHATGAELRPEPVEP